MNKKYLRSIVAVIILIIIIVSLRNNSQKSVNNTIKIGASESLTGNAAYYGEYSKKGADLGLDYINAAYPDYKFVLIHEDNQFDSKAAINNYNKLKTVDSIDAIVTQTTPAALAIEPLAAKDNVLQMAVSVSANQYTSPNDLSFRTTSASTIEAIPMVSYVGKNFKKIAFLYMQNEIGINEATSVKNGLASSTSVQTVYYEGYPLTTTDYRSYLAKIKQVQPDAIYVAGLASHISTVLKQAHDLGISAQFLTFRTGEDDLLIKNSGELAEGIIFTSAFDMNSPNSEMQKFVSDFKAKFNGDLPNTYSAEAYEGVRLIGLAYAKCGKDNVCIKNYLNGLKGYQSVFGTVDIDGNGDIQYGYFLKTVKNGKFVAI